MAKYKFWGFTVDTSGRPIPGCDISVYLAGTTTPAKVYKSPEDTSPISEVPQIKSDQRGYFEFWVSDDDYPPSQLFDIEITYQGALLLKLTRLQIITGIDHNHLLGLQGGAPGQFYHLTEEQYTLLTQGKDASSLHNHDSLYYKKGEPVPLAEKVETIDGAKGGTITSDVTINGSLITEGDVNTKGHTLWADYLQITERGRPTGFVLDYFPNSTSIEGQTKSTVGFSYQGRPRIGVTPEGYLICPRVYISEEGSELSPRWFLDHDPNFKYLGSHALIIRNEQTRAYVWLDKEGRFYTENDIIVENRNRGVVLVDRVTGTRYRLVVILGNLYLEPV